MEVEIRGDAVLLYHLHAHQEPSLKVLILSLNDRDAINDRPTRLVYIVYTVQYSIELARGLNSVTRELVFYFRYPKRVEKLPYMILAE